MTKFNIFVFTVFFFSDVIWYIVLIFCILINNANYHNIFLVLRFNSCSYIYYLVKEWKKSIFGGAASWRSTWNIEFVWWSSNVNLDDAASAIIGYYLVREKYNKTLTMYYMLEIVSLYMELRTNRISRSFWVEHQQDSYAG